MLIQIHDKYANFSVKCIVQDNNQILERDYNNGKFDGIYWDCDRILLGMHQMKITAMDSFGNTATKQVKYFIVNFD